MYRMFALMVLIFAPLIVDVARRATPDAPPPPAASMPAKSSAPPTQTAPPRRPLPQAPSLALDTRPSVSADGTLDTRPADASAPIRAAAVQAASEGKAMTEPDPMNAPPIAREPARY